MPAILISMQGGSIVQVSSMIRDLSARVIDLDLAHEGKPATADVPHRLYGVPILADDDAEPILEPLEIERFLAELEDMPRADMITLFAAIAAKVPGGTAALRDWLTSAEEGNNKVYCETCHREAEYDGVMILCANCDPDVPDPPEAGLYAGGLVGFFQPDEDDPDYDTAMNHLARNGPYP